MAFGDSQATTPQDPQLEPPNGFGPHISFGSLQGFETYRQWV